MFLLFFILMLVTQHALGVKVIEGAESVVLLCEAPPGAASSVTWSREDLNPSNVHVRTKIGQQPEKDELGTQNQLFKSRTEVQRDALTTGNISLTLKLIQLKDGGTYSCLARGGGERLTETQVELQVTSRAEIELGEQARRLLIILITVVIVILCIVAAVLGLLYHLRYIGRKVLSVQQVEVDSGADFVLLPCRTIRPLPKEIRVKWTAGDRKVHVKDTDQPREQHGLYKGRTLMKMKRNLRILVDLSLMLEHPTDRDSKIYTCTVSSKEGKVLMKRHVWLEVRDRPVKKESVQQPEVPEVKSTGDYQLVHMDPPESC